MYRHKLGMSSNLSSDNSMPSDTQKKNISRVHIDYAISITNSSNLRNHVARTSCLNMLVLLASIDRTHKQCGPAIIISGTVIWKAQSATGRRHAFQHTNTGIVWSVLCLLNILPVKPTTMTAAAGESFLDGQASNTMPFPRMQPALHPVNRGVRIVKVWSTSVHRVCQISTSADLSNMQFRVCGEATSECYRYSILKVQTCMIKC